MKSPIANTLRGYKPLLYWGGELLLAHGFDLILADLALNRLRRVAVLPSGRFRRTLTGTRLISRLLRLEVGPACALDDGSAILVCHQGSVFRVDLSTGAVVHEFSLPHGGRPLQLTNLDIKGFARGIYMGEYFSNANKGEARIFHRNAAGHWSTAFTFAAGEINHVHNIVPDLARECVYVLTGDFGDAACIWQAKDGFQSVARMISPGQNSRACWLQVESDSLIYATDTQLELNHLNRVSINASGDAGVRHLQTLGGSSIYRAESQPGSLVFSTAVEPDQVRGNKFLALFSRRRGAGILSDMAHIYAGHIGADLLPIYSARKDVWPFRLFQFGSLQFPGGQCPVPGLIHAYATALTGIDGCTMVLDLTASTELAHD